MPTRQEFRGAVRQVRFGDEDQRIAEHDGTPIGGAPGSCFPIPPRDVDEIVGWLDDDEFNSVLADSEKKSKAAILQDFYGVENEDRAEKEITPIGSSRHAKPNIPSGEVREILARTPKVTYWTFLEEDQGVEPPPNYADPSEDAPRGNDSDGDFPKSMGG